MILINSCRQKTSQVQLISSKTFTDFPSASAIEYDAGRLYVFGDDASYMMILDTSYNRLDTVYYSIDTTYRIAKSIKYDIESATLITHNNEKHLYALGSLSSSSRSTLFYFPLSDLHTYLSINYAPFAAKLTNLPELNIEGMTFARSRLVFANRANNTNRTNRLIIGGQNLYEYEKLPAPAVINLEMDSAQVVGLSGLYYVEEKDLLLFTASEEETGKATEDGVINDSYLGMIRKFSQKMEEKSIKPDELIRLRDVSNAFIRQKIESVCLESLQNGEMILHLAADNDNGESRFFKIRVIQ